MDTNIKFAAVATASAAVAAYNIITRKKLEQELYAQTLMTDSACKAFDIMTEMNEFLLQQNTHMTSMLDKHNVPVDEFDKIAMSYHPKKFKKK